MKLYYLLDTVSGNFYAPFFAENKDVALRNLASDLRNIKEQKNFNALGKLSDSKLFELDINNPAIGIEILEYKKFFEASQSEILEKIKKEIKDEKINEN